MHWNDVKGQARAMRLLQMAYAGGRMPHAWLFHGPAGVGKQMLAVRFARLILCEHPVSGPVPPEFGPGSGPLSRGAVPLTWHDGCGVCKSCRLVQGSLDPDPERATVHPDLHLIHRGLNRYHPDSTVQSRKALDISVDVVRHFLLDPVRGRSVMGKAKIYLVQDAEMLSLSAQNALLKTLEEPPQDTYIILLSSARDRLLATTISRCQAVSFGTLDLSLAERIITDCGLASAEAAFYAGLSQGRPGQALYLSKMGLRGDYEPIAAGLAAIGASDPMQTGAAWQECARRWAKAIGDEQTDTDPTTDQNRQALQVLFTVLSEILRGALRLGAGRADATVPPQSSRSVEQIAGWGIEPLAAAVREVAWAESAIARSANVVLTLEALAVKLAHCSRGVLTGLAGRVGVPPG